MLSNSEKAELARILHETAVYYNRTLPPTQMSMYLNALEKFDLKAIKSAIQAHMVDPDCGHFMPMISQIAGKLGIGKQPEDPRIVHPEPNEAWAIAVSTMDEFETVVTTNQIQEAFGLASPVMANGDEVGARMAFLESYRRIIRRDSVPTWYVSQGFDPYRREQAIKQAQERGLLSSEHSRHVALPVPQYPQTSTALVAA